MSGQNILSLLMKSARLQQKIAAAHAQRNPDTLLIMRLQTLRLIIQKRISSISASIARADKRQRAYLNSVQRRSAVLH
jgi:hypothetical protein